MALERACVLSLPTRVGIRIDDNTYKFITIEGAELCMMYVNKTVLIW